MKMKRIILIILMLISLSVLFSCEKQVPPEDVGGIDNEDGNDDGEENENNEEEELAAQKNKDCTLGYYLNDDGTYLVSVKGKVPTDTFYIPYLYKEKVITDVRLEENITGIKRDAFANPAAIKELIIGEDVSEIETYSLSGCVNLEKITFPFLEESLSVLFADVLPDSVRTIAVLGGESIPDKAFENLEDLERIELPDTATEIGDRAFINCSSLSSVNLPKHLMSIGDDAFSGCASLEKLSLPVGLKDIGHRAFMGCAALYDVVLPPALTSIGNRAFEGCSSFLEITVPDTVKSIGYSAFAGCKDLTSVVLGDGIDKIYERTFTGCLSLKEIILPASLTSIGDYAFENCTSLKEIELPDTLTSIGKCAFEYCSALLTVDIPDKISKIEAYTFAACTNLRSVTVGKNVSEIEYNAFLECKRLWELIDNSDTYSFISGAAGYDVLGKRAKYISTGESKIRNEQGFLFIRDEYDEEYYLLGYAEHSENITLPESYMGQAYNIASHAFSNATNIGKLIIPDAVSKIGDYAFADCVNLVSVTLGSGVTRIETYAFSGCKKLIEVVNNSKLSLNSDDGEFGQLVHLAETVHSGESFVDYMYGYIFITLDDGTHKLIGYLGTIEALTLPESFRGEDYAIGEYAFYGMEHIETVALPDTVTSIGYHAFDGCISLEKINIPKSVSSIGSNAFYGCKSLTSITVPDGVTRIEEATFANCEALRAASLPDSVTVIAETAFYNCYSLTEIKLPLALTTIDSSAFENCHSLEEIVFNDGLEHIGYRAFFGCYSLRTVWLPDSVTDIYDAAFNGCESLVSLRIGKGMESTYGWLPTELSLIEIINHSDMNLVNDGSIKLVHSDTESKIQNVDGLLFITSNGINYLIGYTGNASTLVLPDNYHGEEYIIADYAFYSCNSIVGLVIPESIKSIGVHVTPESLKYFYYGGTEKTWKNIQPLYFLYDEIFYGESWYSDKYGNIRIK